VIARCPSANQWGVKTLSFKDILNRKDLQLRVRNTANFDVDGLIPTILDTSLPLRRCL